MFLTNNNIYLESLAKVFIKIINIAVSWWIVVINLFVETNDGVTDKRVSALIGTLSMVIYTILASNNSTHCSSIIILSIVSKLIKSEC